MVVRDAFRRSPGLSAGEESRRRGQGSLGLFDLRPRGPSRIRVAHMHVLVLDGETGVPWAIFLIPPECTASRSLLNLGKASPATATPITSPSSTLRH